MQASRMSITRVGRTLRIVWENNSRQVEVTATGAMWARWAAEVAESAGRATGHDGPPARPQDGPGGQDAGGRPR